MAAKFWRPLSAAWVLLLILGALALRGEEGSPVGEPEDHKVPGKYGAGLDPNG